MKQLSITLMLALALTACSTSSPSSPTPADTSGQQENPPPVSQPPVSQPPVTTPPSGGLPNTVSGQALDAQGQPIAGALIWVLPSVTTGLIKTRTDDQGRYSMPASHYLVYRTYAYTEQEYRGQHYCLRLAAETPDQYNDFTPGTGVIRNFKLQLSGKIPDSTTEDSYFGATVRLMPGSYDEGHMLSRDTVVEATFTPDGPQFGGGSGEVIKRRSTYYDALLFDVPVGHYRVSAVEILPDGGTRKLAVRQKGTGPLTDETSLEFTSDGTCGTVANKINRVFLYVAWP